MLVVQSNSGMYRRHVSKCKTAFPAVNLTSKLAFVGPIRFCAGTPSDKNTLVRLKEEGELL